MRCWFVPKRSAQAIRDAIKRSTQALSSIKPTGENIDELQKPMGEVWEPILKPFNEYVIDKHGIEGLFSAINSRVTSPIKSIREQGFRDAEGAWIRFAHEVVDSGKDPESINSSIPKDPASALRQAYQYANEAAKRRFQNSALESGLIGPVTSGNHVVLPFDELKVPSKFKGMDVQSHLGILKQMQGKGTQVFSAFAKRDAPKDFMEKVGRGVQGAKHGVVSAIQWTPFFHFDTVLGKFLPMVLNHRTALRAVGAIAKSPLKIGELGVDLARKGPRQFGADTLLAIQNYLLKHGDPAKAEAQARAGYFKLGMQGYESDIASKIDAAMKPRNKFMGMASHVLSGYKGIMSGGVNMMGDIVHDVGKSQLMDRGIPEKAAEVAASRRATQIIGTLPKDMMSRGWRGFADFGLLSMRYTTSTLMNVTRAFTDDHQLAAELKMMGFKPEEVAATVRSNKKAFQGMLLKDAAMYWGISNLLNYAITGLYNLPYIDSDGKQKRGAHFVWENPGFDWYKSWVNIKFVSGVDPATGQVIYSQVPMRTIRDQAMIVMDPLAYMTGAGGVTNPFQVESYKGSPLIATAAMLQSGRDWRGKSLGMPTAPETAASYVGSLGELMQPLPVRDALVKGATLMSNGAYSEGVLRPVGDMISTFNPSNFVQRFGGLTVSQSDPLRQQLMNKQERFRNWLSMPGTLQLLKENNPTVVKAYWKYASEPIVGLDGRPVPIISYSEASRDLLRIQSGQRPKIMQQLEPQGETGTDP